MEHHTYHQLPTLPHRSKAVLLIRWVSEGTGIEPGTLWFLVGCSTDWAKPIQKVDHYNIDYLRDQPAHHSTTTWRPRQHQLRILFKEIQLYTEWLNWYANHSLWTKQWGSFLSIAPPLSTSPSHSLSLPPLPPLSLPPLPPLSLSLSLSPSLSLSLYPLSLCLSLCLSLSLNLPGVIKLDSL